MLLSHTVVMETESTGSSGTTSPAHSPSIVGRTIGTIGAGCSCVPAVHILRSYGSSGADAGRKATNGRVRTNSRATFWTRRSPQPSTQAMRWNRHGCW